MRHAFFFLFPRWTLLLTCARAVARLCRVAHMHANSSHCRLQVVQKIQSILASGEHVDLRSDESFEEQVGGLRSALEHMAREEAAQADVVKSQSLGLNIVPADAHSAAATSGPRAQVATDRRSDNAAEAAVQAAVKAGDEEMDDDFVRVAAAAAGGEYAKAMVTVIHRQHSAARADAHRAKLDQAVRFETLRARGWDFCVTPRGFFYLLNICLSSLVVTVLLVEKMAG